MERITRRGKEAYREPRGDKKCRYDGESLLDRFSRVLDISAVVQVGRSGYIGLDHVSTLGRLREVPTLSVLQGLILKIS